MGQVLKLSIQFLHFDHQPLNLVIMFLMPFGSIVKATPRFGVILKCFLICVSLYRYASIVGTLGWDSSPLNCAFGFIYGYLVACGLLPLDVFFLKL